MITENCLLRDSDGMEYRVLYLDRKQDVAYIFNLRNANALPDIRKLMELEAAVASGIMQIANDDYCMIEQGLTEAEKKVRDHMWGLLSPVFLKEPDIFERKGRGRLIGAMVRETELTKMTIYKYLRKYWKYGKNKNALLPDYRNCGNSKRNTGKTKLGRPRKYSSDEGINVTDEIRGFFEAAVKKYYHTQSGISLVKTYELMLREHFTVYDKDADGNKRLVLLPAKELPTQGQFYYWYYNNYTAKESLIGRKGKRKYDLNHRPVLGKSDHMLTGPGAKFQIDATIGDIYLVSQLDRSKIIGRPVIYTVIDTFSRIVAGIYVGLEGPSWLGAMMALSNAFLPKVDYCQEYGVEITDEKWPCHHVPDCILGDRGEMEGKSVENLINTLGVRIENTPPYRADLKGIIEQYFHLLNTDGVSCLPGHVQPDMKERGGHDYRLDAKLDLKQFTKIMIECVLYHNNEHFMEFYERDAQMVTDDVPAIPIKLWEWGITRYSGRLRTFPEKTIKMCLMPSESASVTAKGIRFHGLYYTCDLAIREGWFEKSRSSGNWKVTVSYDPRSMEQVYLHNPGLVFEICSLIDWQDKYMGMSLDEISAMQELEKQIKANAKNTKLEAHINLQSKIDEVVKEADQLAKQTEHSESKSGRVKEIRTNRAEEKSRNREKEMFVIGKKEQHIQTSPADTQEELSPTMKMIKEDLEQRLKEE